MIADTSKPSTPFLSLAAAALVFLAWAVFSARFEGLDPDIYWHLKYGQLILSEHRINHHDVFSWTAPGALWQDQEWFGQVVTAWLHGLGGLDLLRWVAWGLMLLNVGLVSVIFRRAGSPWVVAAIGAVTVQFLLYGQTVYRLQLFTTLGLTVTALALQTWWLGRSMRPWLYAWPFVGALWANLHGGGSIAGPISISLVLAVEVLMTLLAARPWRRLAPLGLLAVLAWGAIVLTPNGIALPLLSLGTIGDPEMKAINATVIEWYPFDWRVPNYRLYVGWGLVLAAAGVFARVVPPASMLAFALAWGAMAMGARRHLTLAMIASAPLAALLADAARRRLADRPASVRWTAGLVAVAACALLIGSSMPFRFQNAMSGGRPPYPSAAAKAALMTYVPGHRMYHFYDWGGWLIAEASPQVKVFIDGRAYLYGIGLMRESQVVQNLQPGWFEVLDRHRVDRVFVPTATAIAQTLPQSPDWKVVFQDKTATLLVRTGPGWVTHPPAAPAR